MARKDLSPQLIAAGRATLTALDEMGMAVQSAKWAFDPALEAWKFCLVTSLVDSAGRRKAYQLLLRAFELGAFPLSVEDVYLRSVDDEMSVDGNTSSEPVIYRTMSAAPSDAEARALQRAFEQTLSDLEQRSVPA
ncbi:hypothetical protein [Rhizobium sp. FKL33]|uniref:hypothetical protein n=1 Tax=Rhizobium sp. FKL33 TaxID=2562307 RepID=UPI0010C107EA|nr:hypothetical protein [Rhizobium sp. FKL33]